MEALKINVTKSEKKIKSDIFDDDEFDAKSQFEEKNWGKDKNGLKVVDVYSFHGKQTFFKVVEGVKNTIKKGIENYQVQSFQYQKTRTS